MAMTEQWSVATQDLKLCSQSPVVEVFARLGLFGLLGADAGDDKDSGNSYGDSDSRKEGNFLGGIGAE